MFISSAEKIFYGYYILNYNNNNINSIVGKMYKSYFII